jgi:ABC-2 type transport system permease protein
MFFFLPLTCVYYPVSVLPEWIQPISWALPPTAVFEGMRALVIDNVFRADLMLWALGLNVLWLSAGAFSFIWLLRSAKGSGSLISIGE